ncbi:MAG: response regulator [Gammaproteobacteria bacterium]|nr:response regulator [Gammaproteobacteria bacterium]
MKPEFPDYCISNHVLLVEDDPICQKVTCHFLNQFNCNTVVLNRGTDITHCISRDIFDLVLLDIHLADINGLLLCPCIKAMRPDLAVVALTACNIDNPTKYIAAGFDEVHAKPLTQMKLLSILQRYCGLPSTEEDIGITT